MHLNHCFTGPASQHCHALMLSYSIDMAFIIPPGPAGRAMQIWTVGELLRGCIALFRKPVAFVCVHVCVYVYVCVWGCVSVCVSVWTHTYVCVYVCVCLSVCVIKLVQVSRCNRWGYLYKDSNTRSTHTHIHTHTHTHIRTHTCTYAHTCTHAHTYTLSYHTSHSHHWIGRPYQSSCLHCDILFQGSLWMYSSMIQERFSYRSQETNNHYTAGFK